MSTECLAGPTTVKKAHLQFIFGLHTVSCLPEGICLSLYRVNSTLLICMELRVQVSLVVKFLLYLLADNKEIEQNRVREERKL